MSAVTASAVDVPLMSPDLVLPWSSDHEQKKKFEKILKKTLIPLLVFLLIMPWLPVFEPEFVEPENKLVKTKVLLAPPVVDKSRQPKPKPKPAIAKKSVAKTSKSSSKAPAQGIAALSKQLSALRASVDTSKFQNKNVVVSTAGKAQQSRRQLLGQDSAIRKSGGIKVTDKPVMSGSLAAYQSTDVDSPITAIGVPSGRSDGYSSSVEGRRDMESIRRVFEKYKGSVFALYTQSLRSNPELQGKFLFELVIEPDGTISNLKLISSDLKYAHLEKNILAKIREIRFGAEDVVATAVQYKFVFMPS